MPPTTPTPAHRARTQVLAKYLAAPFGDRRTDWAAELKTIEKEHETQAPSSTTGKPARLRQRAAAPAPAVAALREMPDAGAKRLHALAMELAGGISWPSQEEKR